ncbi:MAG: leucyl/phenylalanyl-tRNA--protein transferase [Ignavibacteriales bacterium]|nr:leucyl/phenylalanyl-tRNA--protein transferase [Ignavibacteriales bacterium]
MHGRKTSERIIDPDFLLNAYRHGFFPMSDSGSDEIHWYSPDPRAIFEPGGVIVSRSLRRTLKQKIFDVRFDTAFEQVIRRCAEREETWISGTIIRSYLNLHRLGHAHSVDAWSAHGLAGGLYGVAIGGAFFGESMFSRERDASKIALVFLSHHLFQRGFVLLDTQFLTPHLASLGAREIPRAEYLRRLETALKRDCAFLEKSDS